MGLSPGDPSLLLQGALGGASAEKGRPSIWLLGFCSRLSRLSRSFSCVF